VELNVAVAFWSKLVRQKLSVAAAATFEKTFSVVLYEEKIKNHWFPETPSKGQAFRSVSLDRLARPDPVLLKACNVIGLHNIFDLLPSAIESLWMWVDPGEVSVKICRPSQREVEEVLWKREEVRPVRPPPPVNNKLAPATPLRVAPRPASPPSHHTEEFWQDQVARRRSPSPPLHHHQQSQQPPAPQQQRQSPTRPYSSSPPPNQMYQYYSAPSMPDRFSWSHPGVHNSGEIMWEGRETLIQA